MANQEQIDTFFRRCKEAHGSRYDYSLTVYSSMNNRITYTCPEHGEITQSARSHLKSGCPRCSGASKTIEDVLKDFKNIHGDRYLYNKFEYSGVFKKSIITCREHGDFLQNYNNHVHGKKGCPKCGNIKSGRSQRHSDFKIIDSFKKIHGDKYDYSKVKYSKYHDNVLITCKKHGDFPMSPANHIANHGCIYCGGSKFSQKDYEERANEIHQNKYCYESVDIENYSDYIYVTCPEHGRFSVNRYSHLNGSGCPQCHQFQTSKNENEIYEYVKSICKYEVLKRDKGINSIGELDIHIPCKKIAIEHNGLYWHSEINKDKKYHLNKTLKCLDNNIFLIHIFEDEWNEKKDLCKSILSSKLGLFSKKIYARKCEVREISNSVCKEFLDKNHLQGGGVKSPIRLGLYYNGDLLGVMTFGSFRFDKTEKSSYELHRLCFEQGVSVVGGASKMFKYFIERYDPSRIISYCDRRWSKGDIYKKLGFEFISSTVPNYFYTKASKRYNRYDFTKDKMRKMWEDFDETKTEHENANLHKYLKIWDCGSLKFLWTKD